MKSRTGHDVIWRDGVRRDVAQMLFDIVARQAVSRERNRIIQHLRDLLVSTGSDTGHSRAKGRAWREVIEMLSEEK